MESAKELGEIPVVEEGKYRFLLELGHGGTANVYLAVARKAGGFNKLVVVKVLKSALANDPEFRDMFLNEARLAARLNHPNVVQTNEVVEDQGLSMIVMEYLDGQPLSKVLSRGKSDITLAMRLRIIVESLAGLHIAHELTDFDGTPLGVVHRDMTPQNVFVTYDGQVKVLDFGIAKLQTSIIETRAGVIKGKVRYMPPEQISGRAIDRRADIYAVGVMLWESAVGSRLWDGVADIQIMKNVVAGEIPRPSERRPDITPELERICMKALAHRREDRYATAAELEQDLEAFLQSIGEEARATKRQIAKVIQSLFSDVRQKTKEIVESQLSKVATLSWTEYQETSALFEAPTFTSNSTVGMIRNSIGDDIRPQGKRWGRWLLFGSGAALLVVALMSKKIAAKLPILRGPVEAAPAPAAMTPQSDPSPSTKEGVPSVDRVSVKISASPSQTKIFLDSEQLPSNPYVRTMKADGSQHSVRAEAKGYTSSTAVLVLDKDTDIQLTLERPTPEHEQRARTVSPDRGRARAAAKDDALSPAAAATKAEKADCSAPFFFDSRGVKRFRPECL